MMNAGQQRKQKTVTAARNGEASVGLPRANCVQMAQKPKSRESGNSLQRGERCAFHVSRLGWLLAHAEPLEVAVEVEEENEVEGDSCVVVVSALVRGCEVGDGTEATAAVGETGADFASGSTTVL